MTKWDYYAGMQFAKKEGFALGRDEGVAVGIEKGILQTARKMREKGFDTAMICEITGLSKRELSKTGVK